MMSFEKWSWACLFCAAAAISASGQSFQTIASFSYFATGAYPQYMSLVRGSDGNLYGAAPSGGSEGYGMAFKVTTGGELTALHSFCTYGGCTDGSEPYGGLVQAPDSTLYGATVQGGANNTGAVFTLTTQGTLTIIYSFCSQQNCTDGDDPFAPLIQASDKNFYGTTLNGGTKGYGTVFQVTSAGTLTTLHSFRYSDGASPVAGLLQARNGNFYGTTLYGGVHGAGTVFQISAAGKLKTLHNFGSAGDGANPYAGLVQATDGNFYGTTREGGAHGHGTVFRITPGGKLTTLYSFCSQTRCADGAYPYAGVIQATDSNFYGTTSKGGAKDWGTVFAITPGGELTTLHSFCSKKNCADGANPVGGLVQVGDGTLYGTTAEGGAYENGTVFSLPPGPAPPVEAKTASVEPDPSLVIPGTGQERAAEVSPAWRVYGQSAKATKPLTPGRFHCAPAPCVLPPTEASEGGNPVTDTPIVSNPLNPKQLLLGSVDGNCPIPSVLGFHLSNDGGSTWKRTCMPTIVTQNRAFWPSFDPSVGYDRKGAAYIVGFYVASDSSDGFIAFQKSTDGAHWSKPAVALRHPFPSFPFETGFTVDTSVDSSRVNSLYVSGVMWTDRGYQNQVLVSHSTDGGVTWVQTAVDPVQVYPSGDLFTRMAVGKDGTVYIAWMHCPGAGPDKACSDGTGYMMFSKSTDGGDRWSPPHLMTRAIFPPGGLPNTHDRVYNYPVIAVDNSNGPHSGHLYVAMYTWTGTHLQVQVIRSLDGGTTWSKPVPVAPASDTHDQFFPALSVSPTGKLGVSWLDRRNDPNNVDYQAFAAVSTDGGRTFPNTQLTQAFSNPNTNGGNSWMGDYTGNTWAGPDFIAAWMDSSNGVDMQEVIGGIRLK